MRKGLSLLVELVAVIVIYVVIIIAIAACGKREEIDCDKSKPHSCLSMEEKHEVFRQCLAEVNLDKVPYEEWELYYKARVDACVQIFSDGK